MTESEFLITRALAVYNAKYRGNVKVKDCAICSIPAGTQADRGYEITTPQGSKYFRIRYYFKFGNLDREGVVRLEVAPPYMPGVLGDEVYVIRSIMDNYWRVEEGYPFLPINPWNLPAGIIITERGSPIITEQGAFMVVEGYA